MPDHAFSRARIVSAIPAERVDLTLGDRKSLPKIGEVVELDRGFMLSGERAGVVVCRNPDGSVRWVADVLESEIEAVT